MRKPKMYTLIEGKSFFGKISARQDAQNSMEQSESEQLKQ